MSKNLLSAVILTGIVISACTPKTIPSANMPNPASVYCEQHGGKLDIRADAAGNQYGICVFPNGSECDEWTYYRGQCSSADPTSLPTHTESSEWKTYQNDALGFSFQYPADATIRLDETGTSVFVDGPVVDNNSWPSFVISFPKDRPDYQVPANVNLRQWMIDHHLYVDQPQPDVTLAGTTAIHTRYPRGQQSFAMDHFYFVHNGQLFMIAILHTGDKEDWNVYNQFLQSFKFD